MQNSDNGECSHNRVLCLFGTGTSCYIDSSSHTFWSCLACQREWDKNPFPKVKTTEVVMFSLIKSVYTDPQLLENALAELQTVGEFITLDTKYASRLGVVSGDIPIGRISAVEKLEFISAVQRNEKVSRIGSDS